jgi:hypothetical protein
MVLWYFDLKDIGRGTKQVYLWSSPALLSPASLSPPRQDRETRILLHQRKSLNLEKKKSGSPNFFFIIVLLGVDCDIYKSSYNI